MGKTIQIAWHIHVRRQQYCAFPILVQKHDRFVAVIAFVDPIAGISDIKGASISLHEFMHLLTGLRR
jgi:hypothetical protein